MESLVLLLKKEKERQLLLDSNQKLVTQKEQAKLENGKSKYYPFVSYLNEMECFFVSYEIDFFRKDLRACVSSYKEFFLKNIQPRILADKKKLFSNISQVSPF